MIPQLHIILNRTKKNINIAIFQCKNCNIDVFFDLFSQNVTTFSIQQCNAQPLHRCRFYPKF